MLFRGGFRLLIVKTIPNFIRKSIGLLRVLSMKIFPTNSLYKRIRINIVYFPFPDRI